MGFADDLKQLAATIEENHAHITNEEVTKNTCVLPLLRLLGYDPFNPREIYAEFGADNASGSHKGHPNAVDYAILRNGMPIMLIECKPWGEALDQHKAQLGNYFHKALTAKVGILTNGTRYKFFTDRDHANVMDMAPFFDFDITSFTEEHAAILETFNKSNYQAERIPELALSLGVQRRVGEIIAELLENPSNDFVRLLIRETNAIDGALSPELNATLRPAILKGIRAGLTTFLQHDPLARIALRHAAITATAEEDVAFSKDDNETFKRIQKLCEETPHKMTLVPTREPRFMSVGVAGTGRFGWFLRYHQGKANRSLMTKLPIERVRELAPAFSPHSYTGGVRVLFSTRDDLEHLRPLIHEAFVREVENS